MTDMPTYFGIASHAYFNLAGVGNILDHQMRIPSDKVLEMRKGFLMTGEILDVNGTSQDY
jgi:aldose 1-epimerase